MTDAESPEAETRRPEPAPPPAPAEEAPVEPDWATQYKYLLAEFDNFRKRTDRERELRSTEVRALLLREILPLYDALSMASDATRSLPETDSVRRGVELLHKEWQRFLDKQQVQAVARSGELFRPEMMEAIAEEPSSKSFPAGTIVEVVQQGYSVQERLLRPARVTVARDPPKGSKKDTPSPPTAEEPDEHFDFLDSEEELS